ncbi:tripartite tricarboxylate transporter TctB family protein [Roseivivax sediminis]|uniref:Tripartite tricarboxylate transporter TctB family protein n=1 Tax=Roseivivax sediminis TaxID=936889 RepID=A0A1I1V6V8_9RHOB|nr:tripartite tricarboxylate transporter TctB family protein [Roseivivax sediminis]SFD78737.1 Tripartite tricarboxylate transporter TctB family protein [Roseivivax sediminis]
MADQRHGTERPAPEQTGPDWIIPAIAAAFAVYYVISISALRWEAMISGLFVAIVLGVLLALFGLRTVLRLRDGRARVSFEGTFTGRDGLVRQALLLVYIVAFINMVSVLGFTLGVFSFLFASLLTIARLPWTRAALISGIAALTGYVLFIVALRTQFPSGPFETLLKPAVDAFRVAVGLA